MFGGHRLFFCVRPETIPRTLTDYQRLLTLPYRLAVFTLAAVLAGCSPPGDVPEADRPRPAMIVAGQLENEELVEASGLAASQRDPDILWSMNDGGSKPRIFAFDLTGAHRGRIKLEDARNRDWEDIASFMLDGEPFLLVADVGDNDKRQQEIRNFVCGSRNPTLATTTRYRSQQRGASASRYPDGPQDCRSRRRRYSRCTWQILLLSKRDPYRLCLYTVPLLAAAGDATVSVTERTGSARSPVFRSPQRQDRGTRPYSDQELALATHSHGPISG